MAPLQQMEINRSAVQSINHHKMNLSIDQ